MPLRRSLRQDTYCLRVGSASTPAAAIDGYAVATLSPPDMRHYAAIADVAYAIRFFFRLMHATLMPSYHAQYVTACHADTLLRCAR